MAYINDNYLKLQSSYLFSEMAKRTEEFLKTNPSKSLLRLGIGDVAQPLPPVVIKEFVNAVNEMSTMKSFRGYGPEQGYQFLREVIVTNDYSGCDISADEIFVSDGSKCDVGNIQEIFALNSKVAITNPVYPVYVDSNVMAGRTGQCNKNGEHDNLLYLACTEQSQFKPVIPEEHVDLIYICNPNNPTGTVLNKEELKQWIDYARREKAIILYDAAYEAFIRKDDVPHSIYEVEGAKEVVIEFKSFSKTAGFTGTRCAYTVVPKSLMAYSDNSSVDSDNSSANSSNSSVDNLVSLNTLWSRRQSTKFNGVSYPVQRAASAIYTAEGKDQIRSLVDGYMENAMVLKDSLEKLGFCVFGGEDAPYIWFKTPNNMDDMAFFDYLLEKTCIIGTPGSGFGSCGKGFFRFSAFAQKEDIREAASRLQDL